MCSIVRVHLRMARHSAATYEDEPCWWRVLHLHTSLSAKNRNWHHLVAAHGHSTQPANNPGPLVSQRLQRADHYLLDSPDAAVGIATDRLREEFGAAAFKAQARIILDRVRYCLRGNRAAAVRRAKQQQRWQCRRAHAECFGRPRGHYSLRHRRP